MTDKLNALKAVTFPPLLMAEIVHEHHKNSDGILEITYDFWSGIWIIQHNGYWREVREAGENLESVFQRYCRKMHAANEAMLTHIKGTE